MTSALPELVSYLEGLPEPHILFDRQYRILAANAAYRRQFSPDASVLGRTCHEVSHRFRVPCDQAGETCPLVRARESGQRERVLHLHHTAQGEAYVDIELVPLRDASGEQTCFIEKMAPLRVAQGEPAAAGLIGRSPAFARLLEQVARVGPSNASVLLLGESGTGKELIAHAVHEASARAAHPLVVVDCASLPESLFESELFGHERGAYTGAHAARPGLAEAASGGTLFLDEVGDIALAMQVKLLRLLESGTYRRVGSTELRRTDLRVVAATHRDLKAMVADGRFREDLYHRLSTFPIRLPALRERAGDIALLAVGLLARVAPQRRLGLSRQALARLGTQPFPGNVRELRNVLERAALFTDGTLIDDLQIEQALAADGPVAPRVPVRAAAPPEAGPSLREMASAQLQARLDAHHGSRAELARQLGISERSLYRKLRALAPRE
ncbi:putative sigma54 specific transcriptional regulator [Leptothrix cholodnii SP-6]|uniref:Putative sigma54 specific transcriptional regulator n=1 Tax=Leptothrix cholodnii (strain ATCC 51168 / LMG 8142 / SP-6) TaxID=395495 RepID=B1Y4A6_LEPCP|nr:sigma-54-dependent Fis family transcriptional regulator [Leptothrix cholodnii]ACB35807.1 putative sigma54 specific transcriptional regulator [Leptothrix cholodnii SP-6]